MTRKRTVTLIVLGVLLLAISSATIAQTPQRADETRPAAPASVEASVSSRISYQGLLEEDGSPVTGSRDMTFYLYSDDACTAVVETINQPAVTVANGLFSGVYGYAYAASGQTYGVYGRTDSSSNQARGVYGEATASSGVTCGVRGETASNSAGAAGVIGLAEAATGQTRGVWGMSNSPWGTGVHGEATAATGATYGVDGETASSSGGAAGVHGYAGASSGTINGVFGQTGSGSGRGVYGYASMNNGSRVGVRGEVYGNGDGLYTPDNLYVGGACTGCTMAFLARNTSGETLRAGDVVAVAGVGPLLKGHTSPVLDVRPATAAGASVLGVVYMRGEFYPASADAQPGEDDDSVHPPGGDVAPGDYLLVVTSGLAQVRIAPGLEALTPGQSLTVGDAAGLATLAEDGANPALIFARAMEAQPGELGLVWAMVNTK